MMVEMDHPNRIDGGSEDGVWSMGTLKRVVLMKMGLIENPKRGACGGGGGSGEAKKV